MLTRTRGFSLVEFMIAITVSTIILAALTATFVSNSRARLELDRANQQIENGRYAIMALTDDLQLAGFWGTYNMAVERPIPRATKPTVCETAIDNTDVDLLGWHIQGYDNSLAGADGATPITCMQGGVNLLADYKAGTDVLVIRRAATCLGGSADCPIQAGAPYFQPSMCADELNDLNAAEHFRLSTNTGSGSLNRQNRTCSGTAAFRQFIVHIYYIATSDAGESPAIPTLKRIELGGAGGALLYTRTSLANGIEDLQVEYGIDTDVDGLPNVFTASPDTKQFNAAGVLQATRAACGTDPADAATIDCVENWGNVMSVKVSILARNPGETQDYTDTKVYALGLNAALGAQCASAAGDGTCAPFNDRYKRHVYQSAVRLNNVASRRE